eukprot:170840_1
MSRVSFVFMLLALVLSSVDSRHSRMLLNSDQCVDGVFEDTEEIQCNNANSCEDCYIKCTECKTVNCNGVESCLDSTIVAEGDGVNKLGINCNKENACQDAKVILKPNGQDFEYINCDATQGCKSATFEIDCDGGVLKGVTCKGVEACYDATFEIKNCLLEKLECTDETDSCGGSFSCTLDGESCPCEGGGCP